MINPLFSIFFFSLKFALTNIEPYHISVSATLYPYKTLLMLTQVFPSHVDNVQFSELPKHCVAGQNF